MNRELKFRAYDGKGMMESDKFDSLASFFGYYREQFYFDEDGSKDIPFMQFTGLKDKNNKDIYEGDILNCHEYDSSDCGHRIVQTFKNAVVGLAHGNYYYFPKGNMMQPHQLLMYAYQPEVIGNIYEHPHLIEKK